MPGDPSAAEATTEGPAETSLAETLATETAEAPEIPRSIAMTAPRDPAAAATLPAGWVFSPSAHPEGRPARRQPPVLETADGLVPLTPVGADDGPARLFLACLVVTEGPAPGASTALP
jgi:hypothetical protein